MYILRLLPCRVGLVVSVSASHTVGRGFADWSGHTKDHHKNGTNCLLAWHTMCKGWSLAVQPDWLKGRVECGTVYGDMYALKRSPGSRVSYPGPEFLSSATWPLLSKKHYNGLINQSIISWDYFCRWSVPTQCSTLIAECLTTGQPDVLVMWWSGMSCLVAAVCHTSVAAL